MAKKPKISEKDRSLFQQSVGDVQPLKHDRVVPPLKRPRPHPLQRLRDEAAVLDDSIHGPLGPEDWETGEEVLYCPPGMTQREWRKFRRGQFSTRVELDLHGFTSDQARAELVQFIASAQRRGIRCVRIIHGKGNSSPNGRPVLKSRIGRWLRQQAAVWAFCSARPVDGGTGALYVLLKRSTA
jgi:DNA-nicking Smr family endonuclease